MGSQYQAIKRQQFIDKCKPFAKLMDIDLVVDCDAVDTFNVTQNKPIKFTMWGGYGDNGNDVLVVRNVLVNGELKHGTYALEMVQTCMNCGDGHGVDMTTLLNTIK